MRSSLLIRGWTGEWVLSWPTGAAQPIFTFHFVEASRPRLLSLSFEVWWKCAVTLQRHGWSILVWFSLFGQYHFRNLHLVFTKLNLTLLNYLPFTLLCNNCTILLYHQYATIGKAQRERHEESLPLPLLTLHPSFVWGSN